MAVTFLQLVGDHQHLAASPDVSPGVGEVLEKPLQVRCVAATPQNWDPRKGIGTPKLV